MFFILLQGTYVWGNSKQPVVNGFWKQNEPTGGRRENCVVARDGGLGDYPCSAVLGCICEFYD